MTTLEELESSIQEAITPAFRGRLLSRGQARSMIWRHGVLPDGAPEYSPQLSYDLRSYGFTLLSSAIRLRELGGDENMVCSAFECAGNALEAVIKNGAVENHTGFYRFVAACSFHLGHFSARAFSLLNTYYAEDNLSPIERSLVLLMLRSFNNLEHEILEWLGSGKSSDADLTTLLHERWADEEDLEESPAFEVLDVVLIETFYKAISSFLLALETGNNDLVEYTLENLEHGYSICGELNMVPQWWCFRLAKYLIKDLWASSFHEVLPKVLPNGDNVAWQYQRDLFIASLVRKKRAEVELWPSQLEAARRSIDLDDDLVVSLPTSAGKTRIAELCILRCLAEGKRVVFITPLRALSAQTEQGLQGTFGPLGRKISALYGSIGSSAFESDTLHTRDIVVATPEKLDFALRNDPQILDDVGLVVLDEGHMIGLGEREVRYEVQIQRLLKRADADQRRIVCLSAILPSGQEFDDFVNWLRRDKEGSAVSLDWRPTRVQFGEVIWRNNLARLNLHVGDEDTFVPSFFGLKNPTSGKRTAPAPRDQRELVLATSWRLVEEGQSVLIYCPERRSVEPYANAIVDLAQKGLLESVLEIDYCALASALEIGKEWLGEHHPILKCLELGIAVHHGALPTPYRKEVERLLRNGSLKITVSSPTLAQGLNLSATSVLFHGLTRNREIIPISEFKNVIGRAGRAFVDVEGLVLYPMFDKQIKRMSDWEGLIKGVSDLKMESGLVRLVITLLMRIQKSTGIGAISDIEEYILNNGRAVWEFPEIEGEDEGDRTAQLIRWNKFVSSLDTAIISMIGDSDIPIENTAEQLDLILQSSLWKRSLERRKAPVQQILASTLAERAKAIWSETTASQRKGYFLAGVGLSTGHQLDEIANQANVQLILTNAKMLEGDFEAAFVEVVKLAESIFSIEPFTPDPYPENWRDILRCWMFGEPISTLECSVTSDILRFIESGLIYKLPWGLEAIRVRAEANQDNVVTEDGDESLFTDYETGLLVPAIETGTFNRSAAILMQAGFSSRLAAIRAVNTTGANFQDARGLRNWLEVISLVGTDADDNWPTAESRQLWLDFKLGFNRLGSQCWTEKNGEFDVVWLPDVPIQPNLYVNLTWRSEAGLIVFSHDGTKLGRVDYGLASMPIGQFKANVDHDGIGVEYTYWGPEDL